MTFNLHYFPYYLISESLNTVKLDCPLSINFQELVVKLTTVNRPEAKTPDALYFRNSLSDKPIKSPSILDVIIM